MNYAVATKLSDGKYLYIDITNRRVDYRGQMGEEQVSREIMAKLTRRANSVPTDKPSEVTV